LLFSTIAVKRRFFVYNKSQIGQKKTFTVDFDWTDFFQTRRISKRAL